MIFFLESFSFIKKISNEYHKKPLGLLDLDCPMIWDIAPTQWSLFEKCFSTVTGIFFDREISFEAKKFLFVSGQKDVLIQDLGVIRGFGVIDARNYSSYFHTYLQVKPHDEEAKQAYYIPSGYNMIRSTKRDGYYFLEKHYLRKGGSGRFDLIKFDSLQVLGNEKGDEFKCIKDYNESGCGLECVERNLSVSYIVLKEGESKILEDYKPYCSMYTENLNEEDYDNDLIIDESKEITIVEYHTHREKELSFENPINGVSIVLNQDKEEDPLPSSSSSSSSSSSPSSSNHSNLSSLSFFDPKARSYSLASLIILCFMILFIIVFSLLLFILLRSYSTQNFLKT